jgi:hypothetical protein
MRAGAIVFSIRFTIGFAARFIWGLPGEFLAGLLAGHRAFGGPTPWPLVAPFDAARYQRACTAPQGRERGRFLLVRLGGPKRD